MHSFQLPPPVETNPVPNPVKLESYGLRAPMKGNMGWSQLILPKLETNLCAMVLEEHPWTLSPLQSPMGLGQGQRRDSTVSTCTSRSRSTSATPSVKSESWPQGPLPSSSRRPTHPRHRATARLDQITGHIAPPTLAAAVNKTIKAAKKQDSEARLTPKSIVDKAKKCIRERGNRKDICVLLSELCHTCLILNPRIAEVEGWKRLNGNNVSRGTVTRPFEYNKTDFLYSGRKMLLDQRHLIHEMMEALQGTADVDYFKQRLQDVGTALYQVPDDFVQNL